MLNMLTLDIFIRRVVASLDETGPKIIEQLVFGSGRYREVVKVGQRKLLA